MINIRSNVTFTVSISCTGLGDAAQSIKTFQESVDCIMLWCGVSSSGGYLVQLHHLAHTQDALQQDHLFSKTPTPGSDQLTCSVSQVTPLPFEEAQELVVVAFLASDRYIDYIYTPAVR